MIAACSLILAVSGAAAHTGIEGSPPYSFYAVWREAPKGDLPGRFTVVWNGAYPDTIMGTARLHLPEGVELLSGDTLVVGSPGGEGKQWDVRVRCRHELADTIRGEMAVDKEFLGVDEAEFELLCSPRPEDLPPRSQSTRNELVRRGQRYRYGGTFLVPIDKPERVVEKERVPGRVVQQSDIELAGGLGALTDTVTCVVFVRPNGTIRQVRVLGALERNRPFEAALTAEIQRAWTFEPGRYRDQAIDDWVLIRAPIRRR